MSTRVLAPAADTSLAKELTRRIEAAEHNLERTLEWITRFDNKSSIALGAATGMLGLLATMAPPLAAWTPLTWASAAFCSAALATSLAFVYLGASPQMRGPRESLLYFGAVGRKTYEDYRLAFAAQNRESYLQDLVGQCHRNSVILVEKFDRLKAAYRMLFLGVLPWAVTLVLFRSVA